MKNYIRKTTVRKSYAGNFIVNFFSRYSSYPKLMLEVFVRKNFGPSYFNLFSSLTVAAFLFVIPQLLYKFTVSETYKQAIGNFWDKYLDWYIFAGLFVVFSIIRWVEVLRNPNGDSQASTYPGDPFPFMYKLNFFGPADDRSISIIYEPLMFFVAGCIVNEFGQGFGNIIIISSIFYSLGNYADYKIGDEYIRNMKDDVFLNQGLTDMFADRENAAKMDGSSSQIQNDDDEPTIAR